MWIRWVLGECLHVVGSYLVPAEVKASSSVLLRVLTIVVCALIVLLPAIINGYPLVYSDTGTYLKSAFEGYVPIDRPYWYGVFIRASSFGGRTLWGVAMAQSFLVAVYIWRVCAVMVSLRAANIASIAASLILTAGTGLGWYAGQLIPDVFTGIGLLAMFLLIKGNGTWLRSIDGFVVCAACWMHLSNLLILPLAGMLLLFMRQRSAFRSLRQGVVLLGSVTALAWGGLALANRAVDGKAYISRSSHVFFMGRMLDAGMLRPYLLEHCATEHFGICAYMDSLPQNSEAFLWWDSSPLAKQGGWEATKEEYGRIVRGSFTEPRFLWWHVRGSVASTTEQLCAWEICNGLRSGWYRTADSPPYGMIAKHLPHELDSYIGSMQNGGRGELDMQWPDNGYRLVLALSLIAAVWFGIRGIRDASGRELRILIFFSLAAIIIGAWVCATLSVVDTRYLGRDSWLLPFAVVLAFAQRIE